MVKNEIENIAKIIEICARLCKATGRKTQLDKIVFIARDGSIKTQDK